jgi:hypothetical protein
VAQQPLASPRSRERPSPGAPCRTPSTAFARYAGSSSLRVPGRCPGRPSVIQVMKRRTVALNRASRRELHERSGASAP